MLRRSLGLFQATTLNMIDMVGIGPFVTLPLVMGYVGGMYLYAWVAGAFLSMVDALIWSELGSAYPLAGGSFHFLREAYGRDRRAGRLMGFLYVWQTVIQAPLVAASAAIGFAAYARYLFPALGPWEQKALSGGVILLITFLLYRKVESIGRLGVWLWAGVMFTLGWVIWGGVQEGRMTATLSEALSTFDTGVLCSFAFGQACVKTIYSYLGYYNVCHLGGEIRDPVVNIPRSMLFSVAGITLLYVLMNLSVASVIPWSEIRALSETDSATPVISLYFERLYGPLAAQLATVMILWVALASLFAVLLGYSRVPYAAAVEGEFLSVFGRLHPRKQFPHVSLLILCGLAFAFSLLFKMKEVISGILAMRIWVQFIGQSVGVVLLRKRAASSVRTFRMPGYPLPVVLAILMWTGVFLSTGASVMGMFALVLGSGAVVFLWRESRRTRR